MLWNDLCKLECITVREFIFDFIMIFVELHDLLSNTIEIMGLLSAHGFMESL